ncbi:hypothetical protein CFOL_v3_22323, partial [Cephalotus follicularis]
KYYRYHRDHGHDTEECRQLKNQIEDLIRKGHLRKYVDRDAPQGRREQRREEAPRQEEQQQQQQPRGVIHTISGGVMSRGDDSNARKAYGRQSLAVQQVPHSKRLRTGGDEEVISISEADYEGVHLPHDDPVVVTLLVELFTMKRILIDNGTAPRQTQVDMTFLVVDTPSPYNAIIGRPGLNLLEAIVSTRYLFMKFPTRFGVGEVRGDQEVARR